MLAASLRRLSGALSQTSAQACARSLPAVQAGAQEWLGCSGSRWLHSGAVLRSAEPALETRDHTEEALEDEDEDLSALTPAQVVERLDKYIVGQADAKRAVANAMRMRWRRHKVPSPMKEEIVPKNILMIGPTGCGKTEIARRLAKLSGAPFVKVEATKFTEVGFHGRDVDQIIRDLVDNAITMVRQRQRHTKRAEIQAAVDRRILDALCGENMSEQTRASFTEMLKKGALEERSIEIDATPPRQTLNMEGSPQGMQDMVFNIKQIFTEQRRAGEKRKMSIAQARPLISAQEADSMLNQDEVSRLAVAAVEQDGIVFLDEIDKIVVNPDTRYGADASSEGVQRDLLPIIEGSVVSTKHGNINTDHILFICSGAFHSCKPSDMLAELQGRLPIRVELRGLTADDFYRILTEPQHNMLKQHTALLATEGVELSFSEEAVREVARVAAQVNSTVDNIGARRLHTVLERTLEEVSFHAPSRAQEAGGSVKVQIDRKDVLEKVSELLKKQDLSKYVL